MDQNRFMPRLCFALTAALALLGAVLRAVCMLTAFDESVGYFNKGLLPTLSAVLYFAGALLPILCAAFIPKNTLPNTLHTRLRLPAAFLWGLSLIVFAVFGTMYLLDVKALGITPITAVRYLPVLLALPASLYFFLSGNRQTDRYPDWLSLVGFLPVLWCVLSVAETYTDQFTAMNSPIKIGLQLGFVGLTLILTSELRFRLGKPLPRAAVALMGIGATLALNGSIPVLVGTGARVLDNDLHMLYAVVLLCGGLYGLYVLLQYTCLPAPACESAETTQFPAAPESPTAD